MAKNFNMSYGTLMLKARAVAVFVTRDIARFTAYNVVAGDVTALLASVEAFELLPTNEGLKEEETLLTEAKDEKVKAIQEAIKEVQTRAAVKFGTQTKKYALFSTGEFHRIKDSELQSEVQKLLLHTNLHFVDLATVGLTAAMVTAIEDALSEFVTAVGALTVSIAGRDKATEIRENAANAIYEVILDWCTMGKAIWLNESEAYYNDYIIYDADDVPQTPTDPPTGLQVNMMTLVLTWLAVAGATGYKVKYKFPADSGSYVDAHDGILHTTEFTLAPQSESFKVVVLANNAAGLSAASAELLVAPALAAPGGFVYDHEAGKFVWVMVAGVTFYRMEASYDGGATWQEISAQDFVTGEYVWSPPPGIFRLRGELNGEVSVWVYATIA